MSRTRHYINFKSSKHCQKTKDFINRLNFITGLKSAYDYFGPVTLTVNHSQRVLFIEKRPMVNYMYFTFNFEIVLPTIIKFILMANFIHSTALFNLYFKDIFHASKRLDPIINFVNKCHILTIIFILF